jgi:hypothetical protein
MYGVIRKKKENDGPWVSESKKVEHWAIMLVPP